MKAAYAAAFGAAFLAGAASRLKLGHAGSGQSVDERAIKSIRRDMRYGSGEAQTFDLYLPAAERDSYGLVVYIHGGGFTGGDKREDAPMLKSFAAKGYVAAGVNYTLHTSAHPEASVTSMSREIAASIPVIAGEAAILGYKLSGMAIGGGSAGGCLALIYAYRDARSAVPPLRFVFEAVGPAGFDAQDWHGSDVDDEAAAGFAAVMTGRDAAELLSDRAAYRESLREISAYMLVDGESPPTLCAYGALDKVVPFVTAEKLRSALQTHGVAHDFIVLPHSGHGLQNDDRLYRLYLSKLDEYLERYL